MITNADMTIYNRVANKEKKCFEYKAHYIPAVNFYTNQTVVLDNSNVKRDDLYKIRIPGECLEGYKTPEEFRKNPGEGWTVENDDLFVIGRYSDITSIKDLEALHRPYGTIRRWSDNRRGGLPHIRIGGTV